MGVEISTKPSASPNDELAAQITEALIKARLIDPSQVEKAQSRIAEGVMKREDWRLLLNPKRPRRGRTDA